MRVTAIGLIGLLILTGLLGPLPTSAQRPEKIPRIGVLALGAVDSPVCNRTDPLWEAFQQGLHDLGYTEGQNMRIEYRCGDFQHEQLLALAAELARLPVDVLVTAGPGALAAKQATTTIPIVFAVLADPLGEGARRQPGAARRERHRPKPHGHGPRRQAAGTPHGAGARTPPPCRPLECGPAQ